MTVNIQKSQFEMISPNKKELIEQFINKYLSDEHQNLKTGIVSIQYDNNSTYVGESNNSEKHGNGVYRYSNGDVYLGQWLNDIFHGEGTYLFQNGQFFTGKFLHGQSIEGIYHYKNGNTYVGQFKDYKKQGTGKMHYLQLNANYEGEWEGGEKHGKGTLQTPEWRYEGEWRVGRKEGRGVVKGNRAEFNGEFVEDLAWKGQMAMGWVAGGMYRGELDRGLKHGNGMYVYTDGTKYEGEFAADQITGQGVAKFGNGQYEGKFDKGKREGHGKYTYSTGEVYEGEWSNNIKVGNGKIFFANGDTYQGQMNKNTKQGIGRYLFRDGSEYIGSFINGFRSGRGKFTDKTFSYEGSWENDKMHGQGILNGCRVIMQNNSIGKYL